MLYFGELYNKLKDADTKEQRFKLLSDNVNGSLLRFLSLYEKDQEFTQVVKDIDPLCEDSPYGRTISNFYREFNKFLYFRKEVGDTMRPDKLKDMMERSMLQMVDEESRLLVQWLRGELVWPQTKEEIREFLGVKK